MMHVLFVQEPGRVEAEVARASLEGFLRHIFTSFKPVVDDDIVPTDVVNTPLPPWISDEDIKCYADHFSKNGITGPLNYYRALDWYAILFTLKQRKCFCAFSITCISQYQLLNIFSYI